MTNTRLLIIIVNYGTPNLVADCLLSLFEVRSSSPDFYVVVVDNASPDDSVGKIGLVLRERGWEAWVNLVAAPKNGGFSYGNNLGLETYSNSGKTTEYVYMLNPDTRVHKGNIGYLLEILDKQEKYGIVGGVIVSEDGKVHDSARRFPGALSTIEESFRLGFISNIFSKFKVTMPIRNTVVECDWVSGASMMIRSEVLNTIGVFDENYFLYFEELDFCLRAKKAGFGICYHSNAKITHIGGAATGIYQRKRRPSYWYDSRRRYWLKHHGMRKLVLVDLAWCIGRLSFRIRKILMLGKNMSVTSDPMYYTWDIVSGDAKAIFKMFLKKTRSKFKHSASTK